MHEQEQPRADDKWNRVAGSALWVGSKSKLAIPLRFLSCSICLAVFSLSSSCSHNPATRERRLALLPPDVLIADSSAQWIQTALPLVLEEDLATAPGLVTAVVSGQSAAYGWGANEFLRTTVERRFGGVWLRATITDAATQQDREVIVLDSQAPDAILGLSDALAKRVDARATVFSTRNEKALQLFAEAADQTWTFITPSTRIEEMPRVRALQAAIQLDPAFGLAQVAIASDLARLAPQNLSAAIDAARQHAASFTPLDRARFESFAAQTLSRPPADQEKRLRALLAIAPNDPGALSRLGSLRFSEGDGVEGKRLLDRAIQNNPNDPALREQLGLGLFESRQFRQAEQVLTTLDNRANVLPALAACFLLGGDTKRANLTAFEFSKSLNPAFQPLYRATWLALSGRGPEAILALQSEDSSDSNIEGLMTMQISIWQMIQGKHDVANESVSSVRGPFGVEANLLNQLNEPAAEWRAKVNASSLSPPQKENLLGYGLFLAGHYSEAAEQWNTVVLQSGGLNLKARAMLAASLDRAGKSDQARKVNVVPFVPEFGDLYAVISFNEMRRLLHV